MAGWPANALAGGVCGAIAAFTNGPDARSSFSVCEKVLEFPLVAEGACAPPFAISTTAGSAAIGVAEKFIMLE